MDFSDLDLHSQRILEYFQQISKIPRGSYNEDGMRDYLRLWAESNDFTFISDAGGNSVIGLKSNNPSKSGINIVCQSHIDIVTVKDEDSPHNFDTDPIQLIREGNILRSEKTTLGADNGIGCAAQMYILQRLKDTEFAKDNNLYCLFTSREEIGLGGAEELDPSLLPQNAYLLNLDSEVSGEVCAGSCGGSDSHLSFTLKREILSGERKEYRFRLKNFPGGHSGLEIDKGKISAVKAILPIIKKVRKEYPSFKLTKFNGGTAHNAIPSSVEIEFSTEEEVDPLIFEESTSSLEERFHLNPIVEFIPLEKNTTPEREIIPDSAIEALSILHQGVIHVNPLNCELVDTSTNIGVVTTRSESGMIDINILSRSFSVETLREYNEVLKSVALLCGGELTPFEYYSGWSPNWNTSILLKKLKESHLHLFGKECHVTSVHAGTECSSILMKYPLWEAMSIGPQINGAHTPKENLELNTIQSFYEWLECVILHL